jgi:MoxR-like ATPase
MSRYTNVRTGRKGKGRGTLHSDRATDRTADRTDDRHAPDDGAHGRDIAAERTAYGAELRKAVAIHLKIPLVEEMIEFYTEEVRAHRRELAERQALPFSQPRESYRWEVAPTIALRASKALMQALDKLAQLRAEMHELVDQAVYRKFGPHHPAEAELTGDTAVTNTDENETGPAPQHPADAPQTAQHAPPWALNMPAERQPVPA